MKKKKFDKLGMISMMIKQEDIDIYLDGNLYSGSKKNLFIPKDIWNTFDHSTELSISLLPDEYNIKLIKEGYWPWEKNFTVNPNQTTFTSDIFLFKKASPIKLKNGNLNNLVLNPRNKIHGLYLIIDSNSTSTLSSYTSGKFTDIFQKAQKINFYPSVSGERLLINAEGGFFVLDPVSLDTINLNSFIKSGVSDARWDDKNEYIGYALGKDGILYKIDLVDLKSNKINSLDNSIDFTIHAGEIYELEKNGDKSLLKLLGGEKILITLPSSQNLKFIENKSPYLLIKDEAFRITYIIDPSNVIFAPKIKAILNDVDQFSWNKTNDKLLYSNTYEIWVYDFKENKNYIITRVGEKIKNVLWATRENNILFNTASHINIIEASGNGSKNFLNIFSSSDINEILIDSSDKTEKLFFTDKNGLYSLDLY